MTGKQMEYATNRNLKALHNAVEKQVIAIGGRFGDIDEVMVTMADEIFAAVTDMIASMREYMAEADKEKWRL